VLEKSLDQLIAHIQGDFSPIKQIIEENKAKIEVLEFLHTALNQEYQDIFNYKKYLDYIHDNDVKEVLRTLGEDEAKHAASISMVIREMGAEAVIETKQIETKKEITIAELLEEHIESEKERIAFYQKGLGAYNYPDIQWLIGNLKLEEEAHLEKIQKIYSGLSNKKQLIRQEKKKKLDPYNPDQITHPWME
jgi:rubrerythrin